MLNDLFDFVLKELSFESDSKCTLELFFSLVEIYCQNSGIQMDKQIIFSITRSVVEIPIFEVLNEAGNRITIEDLIAEGPSLIKIIKPVRSIKLDYICNRSVDDSLSENNLKILELIVHSKEAGISQIEIAQSLGMEPKVVIHLPKKLLELELVVKYPYIYQKTGTNIWFHTKFDCYLVDNAL